MAEQGALVQAGQPIMGIDPATGKSYFLAVDPLTGQISIQAGGLASIIASASFTRPADTTQYTAGDLIANSTTTQSVSALALTIGRMSSGVGATGMARRFTLRKTGKSITSASFRLHFFKTNPITSSAVTIISANPGVVSWVAHGLATGCPVVFTTTGALPTNLVSGTTYYAIKVDADTFRVASSSANSYVGAAIDCTAGAQSGVQTCTAGLGGGDNAQVFSTTTPLIGGTMNYVGCVDITCDQAFSDGAAGHGMINVGYELNFAAQTHYVLVEDRGGYTPISGEVFTIEAESLPN